MSTVIPPAHFAYNNTYRKEAWFKSKPNMVINAMSNNFLLPGNEKRMI